MSLTPLAPLWIGLRGEWREGGRGGVISGTKPGLEEKAVKRECDEPCGANCGDLKSRRWPYGNEWRGRLIGLPRAIGNRGLFPVAAVAVNSGAANQDTLRTTA